MTQRNIHSQNASTRRNRAIALRAAGNRSPDVAHLALILAPLAAALILVLVLITGHSSAEYGFA